MCIDEDDAVALVQGTLSSDAARRLRAHAEECATCRGLIAALARMPTVRRSVRADTATPTLELERAPAGEAAPETGEIIAGRYLIDEVIGAGGMGVVYRARDTALARVVAVKRVRSRHRADAHDRLVQEAQTMARLAHPSVVTVFDAGADDGAAYVAMEYIDGTTLRGWGDPARTWREIAALFAQAARGLAAAHDAGIVHGDFKLDNVLVDRTGRPRVADFGLARAAAVDDAERGIAGTPGYMAPELLAHGAMDARTDQFAFWVSLYEALHGARPPAPSPRRIPRWLERAIQTGLDEDRARRHPSMAAVAEVLERGLSRRRARIVAAVAMAGVAGAAGVALGASLLAGGDAMCRGAERKLIGLWDPMRRAAVRASLLATNKPHAAEVAARVEARLDAWTDRWVAAGNDACAATHVHGEQSEAALDLRTQCLARRLGELDALVGLLASGPDAALLDRAALAATSLADPALCADTEALATISGPLDPALRTRIDAATPSLDRARALAAAGRYAQAEREVAPLVADVDKLGPLGVDVLYVQGLVEEKTDRLAQAVATLDRAVLAAERTRQDHVRAGIQVFRVWVVGQRRAQYELGREYGRHAAAIIERLSGNTDQLHGELLLNLSSVAEGQGRFAEVIDQSAMARTRLARVFGSDSEQVARTHVTAARALEQLGKYDEAQVECEKALAVLVRTLGGEHPDVAAAHVNLGNAQYRRGQLDDALRSHQRALAIRRGAFGERHVHVAESLINVGTTLEALGQYERALQHQEAALRTLEGTLGKDHPSVGVAHSGMANSLFRLGRHADALVHYRAALQLHRKVLGDKHPALVGDLFNIGLVHQATGTHGDALARYTEALELAAATLPANHAINGYILSNVGGIHLDERRFAEAIVPLERALALREAAPGDPVELAGTRFVLARALWEAGRDRPRAVKLAQSARDALASAGRRGETTLAEATGLRDHR